MKTSRKIWIGSIAGLLATVGVLVGVKAAQIGAMIHAGQSFVPPPEAVTTEKAQASQWEGSNSFIGSLTAVRGVQLGTELPGLIRQIAFDSGAFVKQGAVLVRLDTTTEEAQLASAQADAVLAKLSLDRAKTLRQSGSSPVADLDQAEARAKQADAAVLNLQAVIAKKTIRAPFDGRVAIRSVELGRVLASGDTVASLQSVDPIYVDFSVPQQSLAQVTEKQKVRIRTDIYGQAIWDGSVSTVNPEVDVTTRNVRIRATLPNADGRLKPGMFVNVDVLSADKRDVLVIPATAVLFAPYGDSVYVVEDKNEGGTHQLTARQKFVRVGDRRGDYVAVLSGLDAGETVVSTGGFKLRNGASVVVNNSLAPSPQLAPKPADR